MIDGLAFSRLAIVGIVSRLVPADVLTVIAGVGEQVLNLALSVELRLELTELLRSGNTEFIPDVAAGAPTCRFIEARVGSA